MKTCYSAKSSIHLAATLKLNHAHVLWAFSITTITSESTNFAIFPCPMFFILVVVVIY